MSELFTEEPMSTALETVPMTGTNPLSIIESAVAQGVDAGQLEKLMELQERWDRNQAANAFGQALTAFQSKCPTVHKSRRAESSGSFQGYAYASFDDVMREASPILAECGLAVSFSTERNEHGIRVTCRIRHGTHYEDHTLDVPVPLMKVNDTQRYGAALSYAKRYALCAALNIVVSDEDDDAGSLGEKITEAQAASLKTLIGSKGASISKFLDFFRIGSVLDLPAARFDEAKAMLERKK